MHSSPTKLNLCHTGITARGVNRLMEVVHLKCETSDVLKTLDLSDNCLKGEDVTVCVFTAAASFSALFKVDSVTEETRDARLSKAHPVPL